VKEMTGGSELTIKSELDDGQLLISVSDTGVGLPPEQADQIFNPFFTTKPLGTGMCLLSADVWPDSQHGAIAGSVSDPSGALVLVRQVVIDSAATREKRAV
jgi:signal transduction histidine kinase